MIDVFEGWIRAKKDWFEKMGLQYEVTKSPLHIDKPSERIDFDNEKFLSRITVWETGECNLEVLDVETGMTILDSDFVLQPNNVLDVCFQEFFNIILAE